MASSKIQQLKDREDRLLADEYKLHVRINDIRSDIKKAEKYRDRGSFLRAISTYILFLRSWSNKSVLTLSLLVICAPVGLFAIDLLGLSSLLNITTITLAFGIVGMAIVFFPSSQWHRSYIDRSEQQHQRLEKKIRKAYSIAATVESEILLFKDKHLKILEELSIAETAFGNWQSEVAQNNSLLLANDWESLTGIPFESWLAGIFSNLGGKVELTKTSGDQGVDLIVRFSHGKVAIQAKGYPSTVVGNKAVQEIYAGAGYHRIDHYAVVTNSTFTKSAKELAASLNCVLVDKKDIENLAFGRIPGLCERNPGPDSFNP